MELSEWERDFVLLDSCQRYYWGIRGILCLIESAYKATGFLKGKKRLTIFFFFFKGITSKQLFQSTDFSLFFEAACSLCEPWLYFIPNKVLKWHAADYQVMKWVWSVI